MNRSRFLSLWGKLCMSSTAEREGEREKGVVWCWAPGSFSTVAEPCFWADVLTVSGSMEGEIPTKRGVQILWEIRPLFNISWSPTIYSLGFIPLEGPSFRLTPPPQWAALNWVPAHFPAPWQIVLDEKTLALHPSPLLPKSGKQNRGRPLLVVWVRVCRGRWMRNNKKKVRKIASKTIREFAYVVCRKGKGWGLSLFPGEMRNPCTEKASLCQHKTNCCSEWGHGAKQWFGQLIRAPRCLWLTERPFSTADSTSEKSPIRTLRAPHSLVSAHTAS